jgi:LPXTG-site transpeptidase (sortase) family protein
MNRTLKRVLLALTLGKIAGVLLLAGYQLASAQTFADTEGTRYAVAFSGLRDRGVIQGYQDGTGRPFGPLTRVEALKVLISLDPKLSERALYFQAHLPPLALFLDTDQHAWYAPSIETAFEAGLVRGYPDRTFHPNDLLTTSQAIALLSRVYGDVSANETVEQSVSVQNVPGQWYTAAVNSAIRRNLISSQERLQLDRPITRGQFFDMAFRMDIIAREHLTAYNRPEIEPAVALRPVPIATSPSSVAPAPRPQPQQPRSTTPAPSPASQKSFAISMPSIGINDMTITHPGDPSTTKGILAPLQYGVGHLFSYPGGGGKILIYGHSSGYAWDTSKFTKAFRGINALKPGDLVYVTYKGKVHTYKVSYEETVPASDMSRYGGKGEELILYTCWPPDKITFRYLVHAVPI